jgi:hypothetical protein
LTGKKAAGVASNMKKLSGKEAAAILPESKVMGKIAVAMNVRNKDETALVVAGKKHHKVNLTKEDGVRMKRKIRGKKPVISITKKEAIAV